MSTPARSSCTSPDVAASSSICEIDREKGPVGKDANVEITALNLLGQKRINLDKGDTRDPAPSGSTIPAPRVSVTTDLDQIVSVLDAPTRARLGVLINQAGAALYGRRVDLSVLVDELAPVLSKTTALLNDLTADNEALGRVVTSSDRFVTTMAKERRSLAALVNSAAGASGMVAGRRAELDATLERAPATLAQAQRFLAELEATARPLGPAARTLRSTGPVLEQTLDQLDPVRTAATPALRTATRVAPLLSRLGKKATPTLRRAVPVVDKLQDLTRSADPVLRGVNGSIDNLTGTLENWARAIQFRDGLSHVFRGEASFTPDVAIGLLNRLNAAQEQPRKNRKKQAPKQSAAPSPSTERKPPPPTKLPQLLENVVPSLTKLVDELPKKVDDTASGVKKTLEGILGGNGTRRGSSDSDGATNGLLDYLLGS